MVNNKMNEYCVSFACSNEFQLNDHNELSEVISMLEDEPQVVSSLLQSLHRSYVLESTVQIQNISAP